MFRVRLHPDKWNNPVEIEQAGGMPNINRAFSMLNTTVSAVIDKEPPLAAMTTQTDRPF